MKRVSTPNAPTSETIGVDRIEGRGRALIAALRERLRDAVPAMRFPPEVDPEFSAAVLIFIPPVDDPRASYDALYERHHIAGGAPGFASRPISTTPWRRWSALRAP